MRPIVFVSLVGSLLGGGCSWTTFDDLGKEATAQSTKDPSGTGSTDWAVAIADTGTGVGGGQLSVLSNDSAIYTNLVYDTKGGGTVTNKLVLGSQGINIISNPPLFAVASPSDCTVVGVGQEAGNPTIVAFKACAAPPGPITIHMAVTPDAVAYVGTTLVIAAGPNLFVNPSGSNVLVCAPTDDATPAVPVTGFSGLGGTSDTLFAWLADGRIATYSLTDLSACATFGNTATAVAPKKALVATSFVAAPGATVLASGNFAVLAGLAPSSTTGKVFVVDETATPALVGTALDANGIASAALGELGGSTYLALGFPSLGTGGEVLVYPFNTTTGALTTTPAVTLADAQPDSGEKYGRSVAIMKYNSSTILTVAAKSEVFAYFALDPIYTMDLRQK